MQLKKLRFKLFSFLSCQGLQVSWNFIETIQAFNGIYVLKNLINLNRLRFLLGKTVYDIINCLFAFGEFEIHLFGVRSCDLYFTLAARLVSEFN